jgi:hypothetical protein
MVPLIKQAGAFDKEAQEETLTSIMEFYEYLPRDVDPKSLPAVYYIMHTQAPTTGERAAEFIHPARTRLGSYMWHNGIIKPHVVDEYNKKYNTEFVWDTAMLADRFENNVTLSGIDGSFAFLFWHSNSEFCNFAGGELLAGRNELVNLYHSNDNNNIISSEPISGHDFLPNVTTAFEPNVVFNLDFLQPKFNNLPVVERFSTFNNPYYLPTE